MIPRNKKIKLETAMQRSFPAVGHQSKRRSSIAFASMAVIASASIAGISIAQDPTPFFAGKIGGTLGTPEQIARDKLAVRIFHSAPVQREMHKLEALYAADTTAQQPDAMVTLKEAAAATAMAQSVAVVNQDPDRPAAYWAITSPHSWGDVKVPLAGVMIDDTDNVYRTIPIDGAASYEIEGKIVGTHPSQETFTLHNELSGADKNQKVRKQEVEAGFVALDKLPVDANGQFTITIDSSPANGRPNHIQSTADVHLGYILIRDTLADWSREDPVKLSVRRVGGPPVHPPKTEAELADRAAALITTAAPYWLTWAHNGFFTHPTNSYTQLVTRASGWGFIKCGRYTLKDDEALLITLDRKKAAYLGFQLSDVWGQGQATNYIENTGSLSASQVRPNPDGTYSYVISVADPGLYNWLNPRGLHSGTFCTRWQNLPESVNTDDAVRRMEVVKLADLKSIFPSDADRVTPAKREQQQRAHLADFMRRLAN